MMGRIARGGWLAALGGRNEARNHYALRLERLIETRQGAGAAERQGEETAGAHAADRPGRAVPAMAGL